MIRRIEREPLVEQARGHSEKRAQRGADSHREKHVGGYRLNRCGLRRATESEVGKFEPGVQERPHTGQG